MAGTPTKERHTAQFLDHVRWTFEPKTDVDMEKVARAVFDVMWEKIDPGEVAKVIKMFPKEMRDLWPRLAWEE